MPAEPRTSLKSVITLDDKWTLDCGRVVINGSQAIARVMLAQKERDGRAGLHTAGYVTGYRGSPLGAVDMTLWSIEQRLKDADILFVPGLNEDIAATALRGTQQLGAVPGPQYDGVFSAWYAKGPGVDRAGDALKHGNYAGTHRNGGVLLFYGDDHAGKSSTVAHASEQAMAAHLIPSLYPADVGELLRFGLIGFALSRFCGLWVGIKCVNEIAEQTASVEIDLPDLALQTLPLADVEARAVHIQTGGAVNPLAEEQTVVERRLPLVHAFIRANRIDEVTFDADPRALGIVAAGKSHGDVRAALALLGLDEAGAGAAGVSLYKLGCIWPVEPQGLAAFAAGQRVLLVVEEKRGFIEAQVAAALINRGDRPLVIGKHDEDGHPLLSAVLPFDSVVVADAIAGRLERLGLLTDGQRGFLKSPVAASSEAIGVPKRAPYFCSGCPHNRSTKVPEGSLSMTGIGCHTMVNFVRPETALPPTQMGGEGGNWLGLAPFTATPHIFQNMGDGTFYHSGLLAIRAAVAAGVNITYKILYNDAVAMTGGQPIGGPSDSPIDVASIARQVQAEGVRRIVLLSDDPSRHAGTELPPGVEIGHRDTLDAVQRRLRETPGCTVLIYEQTCAAEKRRRRKRGNLADPAKRLFIAKAVCEACGDCSVQSTCVSLVPVDTEFGRKRAIDQSSCNKDYSCVDGFCPSFVTVRGAEPRRPSAVAIDDGLFADLPPPTLAPLGDGFNMLVAGIGGTGVVTVGALIGMAAHLDGMAMSLFDVTGLSQKNGAVFSHIRLAPTPRHILTQRLGRGEADLLLAFDIVAALAPDAADIIGTGRTQVIANADVAPTAAFQFDREAFADAGQLVRQLQQRAGREAVTVVNASALALAILGDTIAANLFLVGAAAQRGLLPVGIAALEQAIRLNQVAIAFNLRALALGRLFAIDPARVLAMAPRQAASPPLKTLGDIVPHRAAHLTRYQDARLAERYRALVERVAKAESTASPGADALAIAVARNFAKLLAYKDEYEVARLLTAPGLHDEIRKSFAEGAKISFNLAPPVLAGKAVNGRPGKREIGGWLLPCLRVLARLKRLRGTWADPFGHSSERRTERALIADYEQRVGRVIGDLSAQNHAAAVRLLSLPDIIRGFGPVKAAAIDTYRGQIVAAEQAFVSRRPTEDRASIDGGTMVEVKTAIS